MTPTEQVKEALHQADEAWEEYLQATINYPSHADEYYITYREKDAELRELLKKYNVTLQGNDEP